jgi:hypothetical protein
VYVQSCNAGRYRAASRCILSNREGKGKAGDVLCDVHFGRIFRPSVVRAVRDVGQCHKIVRRVGHQRKERPTGSIFNLVQSYLMAAVLAVRRLLYRQRAPSAYTSGGSPTQP